MRRIWRHLPATLCCLVVASMACAAAPDPAAANSRMSGGARHAARWVVHHADHRGRPFAIVDKKDARIYVFEPSGVLIGASPVLLGLASGDRDAVPRLGERSPGSLAPIERTTPAGRFDSEPGRNDKGEAIVWFDYDAALAIHRLRPAPAHERRAATHRIARPCRATHLVRLHRRAGRVLRTSDRAHARQPPRRGLRAAGRGSRWTRCCVMRNGWCGRRRSGGARPRFVRRQSVRRDCPSGELLHGPASMRGRFGRRRAVRRDCPTSCLTHTRRCSRRWCRTRSRPCGSASGWRTPGSVRRPSARPRRCVTCRRAFAGCPSR